MTDKKQYYGLDEIGFIGTQDRTPAQAKADMKKMAEYIRAEKAVKAVTVPDKRNKPASKTK